MTCRLLHTTDGCDAYQNAVSCTLQTVVVRIRVPPAAHPFTDGTGVSFPVLPLRWRPTVERRV